MERLYIGDDVCVTVVRLEGGQVRLGIEAPRHISVVRAELVPDREPPRSAPRQPVASTGLPGRPVLAVEPGADANWGAPVLAGVRVPPPAIRGIGNRRRGPSQ